MSDNYVAILQAYATSEDIIETFDLTSETSSYPSPGGFSNCYYEAQNFAYVNDCWAGYRTLNQEVIDSMAQIYATELASSWIDGASNTPIEVINWAYNTLSTHGK